MLRYIEICAKKESIHAISIASTHQNQGESPIMNKILNLTHMMNGVSRLELKNTLEY